MKIALIGYGKMGKEIEKIAAERGHEIVVRSNSKSKLRPVEAQRSEVAIEFTTPDTASDNIQFCLEHDLPVVVGSTGWYGQFNSLKLLCEKKGGSMLYATNFSVGVNLFYSLNTFLARIMAKSGGYVPSIQEIHHTQKQDAPSGTAISLAEQLMTKMTNYKKWANVKSSEMNDPGVLSVESIRLPDVPGTHKVKYTSPVDTIEITHTAHNRTGFALGSVLAAEWLKGKKGIFTFSDVLNF